MTTKSMTTSIGKTRIEAHTYGGDMLISLASSGVSASFWLTVAEGRQLAEILSPETVGDREYESWSELMHNAGGELAT